MTRELSRKVAKAKIYFHKQYNKKWNNDSERLNRFYLRVGINKLIMKEVKKIKEESKLTSLPDNKKTHVYYP